MKKICLLLLVMCQIWTFTACTEKDKEPEKPKMPVTGLSVAPEITVGEELNVLGKGFTETSELYVKNEKGELTKLTVKSRLETGLVVVIPATLNAGTYKLILKQGGEEWELQDIKLLPAIPLKNLNIPDHVERGAVLTITGEGFVGTCKVYLKSESGNKTELVILKQLENGTGLELRIPEDLKIASYDLLYAVAEVGEWSMGKIVIDADQRMKKVVATTAIGSKTLIMAYIFEYDAQNRVTSILKEETGGDTVTYALAYSGDQLTVTKAGKTYATYTISENRVSRVAFTNFDDSFDEEWTYDDNGYWKSIPVLEEEPFGVRDGNINYLWDENTPEYIYDVNSQVNNFRRDVFAYMLVFTFRESFYFGQIEIPFLIGLAGKPTAHLPTGNSREIYEYTSLGAYITGVVGRSIEDKSKKEVTFEFKYELAQ